MNLGKFVPWLCLVWLALPAQTPAAADEDRWWPEQALPKAQSIQDWRP